MPDLSKSIVQSPLHTLTQAEQHTRGDFYGSADTSVGRLFGGNYYDEGLTSYDSQQNQRYYNQGPLNAVGNFMADLGVQTLSGIPSIIGGVTGIVGGATAAAMGGKFTDGFDDNPFLNFTKTMNAWGDENFPQMYQSDFQDKTFSQKLFTAPGQLATSNVSTLGFLAQSFGLSGLLAKAGVGARVIQAVAKGKNFSAALSELAAPDLAKIASSIDEVTLNAFLTTNEAAMEGQDAHDTIIQQLRTDRIAGKNDMSDEEINKVALNSLGNVFWENMLALSVTNGYFTKLVSPLYSPKAIATRGNRFALKALAGTESMAEASAANMSKFERFLFNKGDAAGMVTKALLEQAVSEGAEEDIQYSIQKVNDVEHLNRSLSDSLMDSAKNFLTEGLQFSDPKRAESVALGSIIGAGSTAVATAAGFGPAKEARKYADRQKELVTGLNKNYTDFFSASTAKKSDPIEAKVSTKEENGKTRYFNEQGGTVTEISPATYQNIVDQYHPDANTGAYEIKGKYEIDAQGNVLRDPEKVADFASKASLHSEYDDLIDVEASKPNVDKLKVQLYQLAKLNSLADSAFESGNADMLIKKLESYKGLSEQDLQQQGIDPKDIEENVNNWVDHVKRLEKSYNSVQNAIIPHVTTKQDEDILSSMKKTAASTGARIVALDRLIIEANKAIGENVSNSEDPASSQMIADAFASDETLNLGATTKVPEPPTELARLITNKKELVKAREQLGEIYTKLLDPKKGFANYKKATLSKNFKEYLTPQDTSDELLLNEATTPEDLTKYKNRRIDKERHQARMDYAKTAFFSDAINKFINFFTVEGPTPDAANSLKSLIDKITSQKLTIYPDQANKLKSLIDTLNAEVSDGKKSIEDKLGNDHSTSVDMAEYGESPEIDSLLDDYGKLEDLEVALGELNSSPDAVKKRIDNLTGYPTLDVSEDTLAKKALDRLLLSPRNVVDAFEQQGDDYDDLDKVQYDLARLNELKRLYESDNVYKSQLKEVKKLIKALKEIEKTIIKNRQNKDLKNKKQDLFYAEGHLRIYDSVPATTLREAGITDVQLSQLVQLRALDPVLAAKVSMFFLSELPKERLQELASSLETRAKDLINSLEAFKVVTMPNISISAEELESALTKPTKSFSLIFSKLLDKENRLGSINTQPLEEYEKTYDVVQFQGSLNKFQGTTTPEELSNLIKIQSELIALSQLSSIEDSSFNEVDFLDKAAKSLEGKTISPSSSQFRVVRELAMFVRGKHDSSGELFTNGSAMKAPAGAGKSLVVASLLKASVGLQDKEILTAAPHEKAADNIAKSTASTLGSNTVATVTDLLNRGAIPATAKIIIVDEAGALNLREIYEFARAFAKFNRENPTRSLKFIMLYDPNQITPGNVSVASLDLTGFHEVSPRFMSDYNSDENKKRGYRNGEISVAADLPYLPFIQNITQITPLSTVYRSDVSEIVDLQNRFKTAAEVTNLKASASVNPNVTTKDILGTFVEMGTTIADKFAHSMQENPSRSRVIVTGTTAKQAHYKALFPTAEVLTVPEAQGITRDEVFVDLEKIDHPNFEKSSVFNQYMYTATSRAAKYLHISNSEGTFAVDTQIPSRVEAITKAKKVDTADLVKQLKEEAETIKNITKQTPTPPAVKPEILEPEVIKETQEQEDSTEEVILTTADAPTDTPPEHEVGITGTGEHKLFNPSSNVFEEDDKLPAIKSGSALLVVKDITQKVRGGTLQRFLLVQPLPDEQGNPYAYRIAGVLGDQEIDKFSSIVPKSELDALEGYVFKDYSSSIGRGVIGIPDGTPITSHATVYVSPKSHDIIYVYGNTSTYDFKGDTDVDGKLQQLSILESHLRSMFHGEPEKYIQDYEAVLNNFQDYTQIVAFKSDKEIRRAFPKSRTDKQRPLLNVPYLIIHGIPLINGSAEGLAPQFIRLIPSVLNMNTAPELGVNTDAIVSFISKVKDLEAWVPKLNLGGKYGELKNGGFVTIDANQKYYPFHYFVTQLSKAYQALQAGESWNIEMTDFAHLKEVFPTIDASTLPMDFLKLGYDLDILVHGEVEEKEKREYKGEAQMALDAIGTQNLIVTLPNGKNVLLKDYRTTFFNKEEGREVSESAGFSLLGPLKFTFGKGMAYNPLIKDKLALQLQAYLNKLINKGEGSSTRAQFIKETLADYRTKHLNPTTTEDLEELFLRGQDKDGNLSNGISEGFGLRQPMLSGQFRPDFYKDHTIKDLYLGGQLETNFEKIIPTQIVVTPQPIAGSFEAAPIAPPRELSPIDRLRRSIREGKPLQQVDDELKREFAQFMETDTFEEAVALYQDNMSLTAGWKNSVRNIYQALQNVKRELSDDNLTTKEAIFQDIKNSVGVTGVGKGAGVTAARDFIRGTVLLRVFPNATKEHLAEISDFARTYYKVNNPEDIAAFEKRLIDIGKELGQSEAVTNQNLFNVLEQYEAIAVDNNLSVEPGELSQLQAMQYMVDISSAIRQGFREASAAPIGDRSFKDFLLDLINSADNVDSYEDTLNAPANAKLKEQLESKVEGEATLLQTALELVEEDELKRSMLFNSETEDIGELLTDAEVEQHLASLSPPASLNFFQRLWSKTKSSKTYRIVDYNSLKNSQGDLLWGQYKSGLMEFARHSSGRVGSKVLRHEFFHKVFWEYLTPGEQLLAIGYAKDTWGDIPMEQLEERMAENFADYKADPKTKTIFRRIWDMLLEFLGFTTRNFHSLPELFNLINSGKFKNKGGKTNNIQRSMLQIGANFDSLQQFKLAKATLLGTFSQLEQERKKGDKAQSFSELVELTYDYLKELRDNPGTYYPTWEQSQRDELVAALNKLLVSKNDRVKKAFNEEFFGQTSSRTAALNLWEEDRQRRLAIAAEEKQLLADRIQDGEEVSDKEVEDADAAFDGINNEKFDSELRDPKIKITGNVKQRLVSIKYNKNGQESYAEFGKVFAILLNKVSSIPTSSLSETLSAIEEEFKLFKGSPGKLRSSIREATGKFMLEMVDNLKHGIGPNSTVPESITFKKDINYKHPYAIVSKDGSSTRGLTRRDAELDTDKYVIIPQREGTSTDTFVAEAAVAANVSKSEASSGYYFFEDLDFIKSLVAAVASLRENKPHVAYSRWEYGRFKAAYFRSKTGGGNAVLENKVGLAFSEYVATRKGDTLFGLDYLSKLRGVKDIKDKKEAIKDFLRTLGIKGKLATIDQSQEQDIEKAFSSFSHALESMEKTFSTSVENFDSTQDWEASRTATAMLADEATFVQDLVTLLNTHYELAETNSYIRGDGKKAYGYIDESYQGSVLTSIARAILGKTTRKFNSFSVTGGRLSTTDRFLKDNIFFKGISQIKGFIDHDSLKNKGNERFAKYLRKENAQDFDKRHITFGFFSRLRSSRSNSYYQFLPIPSNRTTIQAVEVKALNMKELKEAYSSVIKAQKNRPDPKNNPDLAAVKGYSDSYKQWKLGPLQGSVDSMTEAVAWNEITKHADEQAKEVAQDFLMPGWGEKPKIPLDDRDITYAAEKLLGLRHALPKATSKSTQAEKDNYVNKRNELIQKILPLFYLNFGVNNYSLSQLLYGDEVFYGSKEVETKRIQIVTATGDTLLVDENYGLPAKSKVLIVADAKKTIPDYLKDASNSSYRESYEASDAEGYMLPEFYEKVAATYGIESLADVVLKPVYFNIQNGIPTAVKYSVKVLTDAVVDKDPVLKQYRDMMRKAGADQLTFKSAVKVGSPKGIAQLNESDFLLEDTVNDNAIITIDNQYLRFQLNPAKSPEVTTANPSQGTAFMNTNGLNTAESAELHRLNAVIIENGLKGVFRDLKLTKKGGLTGKSIKILKNRLASSLEGVAGSRDIYNLLSFRGKDKVSLSLPLIADRVVATLSSIMTSATTGFRFAGSKLVLQAELGKRDVWNDKTQQTEHRYLKYRDDEGFCEVILPKYYESFMKKGDKFLPGSQNGIVGFRIPSTNYHSLLPLKVVGFYDAPVGAKANVVIAPSALVYFHGSDYDVDTLFTMHKEAWKKEDVDLSDALSYYQFVKPDVDMKFNANSIIGFDANGSKDYDGQQLHDFLQPYLDKAYRKVEDLTHQINRRDISELAKNKIDLELQEHNKRIDTISSVLEASAKNHIVDLFSTNMQDPKNRKDLLTAISFARVASLKTDAKSALQELLKTDEFLLELKAAGLIDELKC